MNGTETMTEAVNRLVKSGYGDSFRAKSSQLLGTGGVIYDTSDFVIDETVRFEGTTDLDDESAIFALTHKGGKTRGLYIVAFGPQMDTDDVLVVQKLKKT